MTELERITHAKNYINMLANGYDPLSGMPISENDVVNNVHISRCFFYVASLLDKIIENGGPDERRGGRRQPFFITPAQCAQFEYSSTPITVSEITRRLNVAAGSLSGDAAQLRYSSITFWLIEVGMLAIEKCTDGKELKRPTEAGSLLGISIAERAGNGGRYTVVVYDEEAQHFIVDNIPAVMEAEKLRFKMQGMPWSDEDDAILMAQLDSGAPIYEIALLLKRNISSVRSRLKKLGLTLEHQ